MTHQLEIAADYEAARAIGPWLAQALDEMSSPQAPRVGELELAIHELAINIVDHAYDDTTRAGATYRIELDQQGTDLHARFCDGGHPFVDERPEISDEPTVGGYGLMIVEQLARSVTYSRVEDENRWTLVFGP